MKQKWILGLIAAVCVAGATSAAFGQVLSGDHRITWSPEGQELTLAIAGPNGFVYTETFPAGVAPDFAIFDAEGGLLKDGVYTWEIVGNPEVPVPDVEAEERGLSAMERSLSIASSRTGAFSIARAGLVPEAHEGQLETKDVVHPDDVIIQFSLCVGNDCVNGESFGFDTLRLKENNLRIHFQDTSTSASFPSNDWRIVINDSSNGGGNYWAIEDSSAGRQVFRVDAGAPANALRVDSGGDVGIGTATPVVDLHVVSGNTPTLRLEQNGSSGFTAQTWDLAGNEANFFLRDVTNGSALSFRVEPGADQDSLFIEDTNDIGMGTNNPSQDLHVRDASSGANVLVEGTSASIILEDSDATADQQVGQLLSNNSSLRLRGLTDALGGSSALGLWIDLADGDVGINCNNSPDQDFIVGNGGTCTGTPRSFVNAGDGAWSTTSSRSYKENLEPVHVEGILEEIAGIDVYTYDFIDGAKDKLGLVAEDFYEIFGRGSDKVLNGQEVQMALWLAVQELTARLVELEAQNSESGE